MQTQNKSKLRTEDAKKGYIIKHLCNFVLNKSIHDNEKTIFHSIFSYFNINNILYNYHEYIYLKQNYTNV